MMEAHTGVRLDSWPTPVDYAHSLTEGMQAMQTSRRIEHG